VILSEPRVSQRFLQTLPCWDQGRDACTWGHTQFTAGIDTLLSVTACLLSQRQCPVFIDLFLCHPCQGQASHTWTQPWLVPGAPGSPRRWVWSLTTASSLAVWGPWWPWSVPGQWGIWPVLHGVNMPAYVCVCVCALWEPLSGGPSSGWAGITCKRPSAFRLSRPSLLAPPLPPLHPRSRISAHHGNGGRGVC
jgi:hypothetical protein